MPLSVGELIAYLRLDSVGFDRGIAAARTEMSGAATSARQMGVSVGEAEAALAGAGRQATLASSGTAKFRQAQLSLLASTERYNKVLADESATLGQLARAEAAVIGANERLRLSMPTQAVAASNREIAAAPALLGRTSSGLASAARSAVGLGVAFGAFELAKKAIDIGKEATQYQASMTRIRALTGASTGEITAMSKALLGLSGKVAQSPEELATSLYHAEAIGLRGAHALDLVTVAAKGARIGNADLEETTNALTSTVASGITKNESFTKSMSELLTIVGSGDMKLADFNDALATGGLARLSQFGLNLHDVGAALAVFGDNNIRGRNAIQALIQSVQSMAVVAPKGQAELKKFGISGNQLAKDLQTGGLNKAITDLREHLRAAGVKGKETGAILTSIFTKRAGAGLAVLLDQSDRLASKYKELNGGALTFNQRWKEATHTASFAFKALGDRIQAAGIQIIGKATPAVGELARGLAVALPAALSIAATAATPFVAVFRQGAAIIGPIAHSLMDVSGALHPIAPEMKTVAAAALGMYAAVKLIALGKATFTAINYALGSVVGSAIRAEFRMRALAASTVAVARGQQVMSLGAFAGGIAAIGVAGYAAGKGLSNLIEKNNSGVKALNNATNLQKTYTAALDATNGALTNSVRTTVAAQLQTSGLADKAAKAHISLADLTNAVTGGDKALAALGQRWKKDGTPSSDTIFALGLMGKQYQAAVGDAKDLGTVTAAKVTPAAKAAAAAIQVQANSLGVSATAYAAAQKAAKDNTAQTTSQTLAFQLENDAASLLQNALNGLAGVNLSVATAQTGLASANLQVAAAFKQNGRAIQGNGAKAVANQQAIQGSIQAAQQYAEAIGKQTGSSVKATAALASSKAALEAQLRAQGNLTPAVQAYIDKLFNLKNLKVPPTKLDADTTAAMRKTRSLQDALRGLGDQTYTANVSLQINGENVGQAIHDAVNSLGGSAVGTKGGAGLPLGLSSVGEQGPELAYNDGSRTHIISNGASKKLLAATGLRAPGFASGTGVESAFASLLASLGVGRAGQAGALGNGQAESNFNTRALNSIGALGVFQWLGGRKAGLEALAHRMGVGANTEAAQLAFFKKELTGPFKNVLNGLRHAKSARSAATLFNEKFEISGDTSGNRENNAARIYNQLKSGKLAVTGGTGGKTGLTQVANSSAALNAYNALGKAVKIGRDPTKGTPSATVLADLQRTESALTKAGASAQFVASITKQNKRITALAYARNVAASHLAAATKAVAAAVDTFNQDKASFKSAGVGSFDLTSAGADANGRVSRGSLLASQAQTVTKVRSWVTGMKRLIASKVFPGAYLRTLLGDGPASLPTVQALLQMSAADMKSFAANERTIDSLSGQIASAGAHKLDDPAIAAAKATQAKDAAIEARLQHRLEVAIDQVGDRVANELSHLNIQSKIGYKQGDLWIAVESDKKKSTHRKATSR